MGSDHKEILDKYKGVYQDLKLGRTITLTHFEKVELARVREQLVGLTTNLYCGPCLYEMLNDVFRDYNSDVIRSESGATEVHVPDPLIIEGQFLNKVKQGIANVFKK